LTPCTACSRQGWCDAPKVLDIAPEIMSVLGPAYSKGGWTINVTFDRKMQLGMKENAVQIQCQGLRAPIWDIPVTRMALIDDLFIIDTSFIINDRLRDCDIYISPGGLRDRDDVDFIGISAGYHTISMPDTKSPELTGFDPRNSARNMELDYPISFTFNEGVSPVSGFNFTLVELGDKQGGTREADKIVATLELREPVITFLGSTVVVEVSDLLTYNTLYSISIPAGSIVDDEGNEFAGLEVAIYAWRTLMPTYVEEFTETENSLITTIPGASGVAVEIIVFIIVIIVLCCGGIIASVGLWYYLKRVKPRRNSVNPYALDLTKKNSLHSDADFLADQRASSKVVPKDVVVRELVLYTASTPAPVVQDPGSVPYDTSPDDGTIDVGVGNNQSFVSTYRSDMDMFSPPQTFSQTLPPHLQPYSPKSSKSAWSTHGSWANFNDPAKNSPQNAKPRSGKARGGRGAPNSSQVFRGTYEYQQHNPQTQLSPKALPVGPHSAKPNFLAPAGAVVRGPPPSPKLANQYRDRGGGLQSSTLRDAASTNAFS